jgi:hypothetical protein
MVKLRFLEPMTCQQIRGLFADLLAGNLDVERQGRVEGHLLACEECSVAFAEEIDRAFVRGVLPQAAVPPVPIPLPLVFPHPQDLFGRGVVKAPRWDAVKRAASAALGVAQRTGAATVEVAGEGVKELLVNLERRLQGSFPLWQLASAPAGGLGLEPSMGGGGTVLVQHLNETWEPAGTDSVVDVEEGPVVTAGGEFRFTVTSEDARLAGQRLICTVQLVEGEAIRFESDIHPTPDGKQWRAEFRADGLPAAEEDVSIPLDAVSLYSVPRPQTT